MEEIDLLDKKILAALNHDVRASYSELAKKVRSSKEVVNYRIRRLEEMGIIKEYVTIFGMGYWANKVLLDFSQIDQAEEKRIIDYLKNHPYVNWLTPCSGGWDLVFAIMAKDPKHFDTLLREILLNIGKHVREYKTATSIGSTTFGHTYLLGQLEEPQDPKRNANLAEEFDDKDRQIARMLHRNARAKIVDIYKKTKIPADTIVYRIKKMEANGIIRRYRLVLDPSKLGYHRYEVFLRCTGLPDKTVSKFKQYAQQNKNVEFFSRCVGGWDVELTIHLKTNEELRDFIMDVKKQFGEHIQKFETINLFETHNFVYLPMELS